MAALKAFGVREVGDDAYELSDDAAHNRFVRERNILNAQWAAKLESMQGLHHQQLDLTANFITSQTAREAQMKKELEATNQQLSAARDQLACLEAARSSAPQRAREAEGRAAAAEAAAKEAQTRAVRAERTIEPLENELAIYRAAPTDREQYELRRQAESNLPAARERIRELEGARVAAGLEAALLRAQLGAAAVQEDRVASSRQLQVQLEAANATAAKLRQDLIESHAQLQAAQCCSPPASCSD